MKKKKKKKKKQCYLLMLMEVHNQQSVGIAVPKAIPVYFAFALLRSVIGLQTRATFSTNERQNQRIVTCSHTISRAWRRLHVIVLNSDWFIALFTRVMTLNFVLRHSIEERDINQLEEEKKEQACMFHTASAEMERSFC